MFVLVLKSFEDFRSSLETVPEEKEERCGLGSSDVILLLDWAEEDHRDDLLVVDVECWLAGSETDERDDTDVKVAAGFSSGTTGMASRGREDSRGREGSRGIDFRLQGVGSDVNSGVDEGTEG